jgi:hypothetical protein
MGRLFDSVPFLKQGLFQFPPSRLALGIMSGFEFILLSAVLANAQTNTIQCMKRPATMAVPPPSIPLPTSGQQPVASGADIKPVCPDGQIPVWPSGPAVSSVHHLKGNPLLRPQSGGSSAPAGPKTNRFLRFNDIHGKLGRQLSPTSPCSLDTKSNVTSCFYYGAARAWVTFDGGAMTLSVNDPGYSNRNASGHSLNELSVQGPPPNTNNILEIGWLVSTDMNPDSDPHIFVFYWVNGIGQGYNGGAWQQFSSKYYPGQNISLLKDHDVYTGYVFYQGNWWAWFDNEWLGYYPGTAWKNAFSKSSLIQGFGEVATAWTVAPTVSPKIQMGDGLFPNEPTAAHMLDLCGIDTQQWKCSVIETGNQELDITDSNLYSIAPINVETTRYGGPGNQ